MSEETHGPVGSSHPPAIQQPALPAQSARVDINSAGLTTTYTNFFRVTGTYEELVLDFGLHTGSVLPSGPEPVKLSQRIIMNFATAKRMLAALQVALGRHEQVFGNIEIDPQKRVKRGG